jgi:hypothetical protein
VRNIIVPFLKFKAHIFQGKKLLGAIRCVFALRHYSVTWTVQNIFAAAPLSAPRIKESEMDYSGASERRYISRDVEWEALQPRAGKKGRTSQRRDREMLLFIISSSYFMIKKNKSKDSEEGKKKVDDELDGMSLPAIVANPLNRSAQMTKACLILFVVHRATRTAAQSPTKISRSISPSSTPEFHLRMIEPKRVVGKKGTGRQLLHVFSAPLYLSLST